MARPEIAAPQETRDRMNGTLKGARMADDWNKPIPHDLFMEHFAAEFAGLGLTPGQISALVLIGAAMQMGLVPVAFIKAIAAALEGPQDD